MKRKLLYPVILISCIGLIGFPVHKLNSQTLLISPATQPIVLYTCPMHPEVVLDKPGNCPKCGMKLVEKKADPKGSNLQPGDTTAMKPYHKRMMCDSTSMNKGHIMNDSTRMKQGQKGMK
jgi:hypothetical protein